MNKNYIYITIAAIVIVLIGGFMLITNNDGTNNSSSSNTASEANFPTRNYLAYNKEAFESTEGKKLLYFYANWCSTCRPVNKELQERTDDIPADLTIFRVNYADSETDDLEKDLARANNITYQHTFVLYDENGEEIKRWSGGGLEAILQNI